MTANSALHPDTPLLYAVQHLSKAACATVTPLASRLGCFQTNQRFFTLTRCWFSVYYKLISIYWYALSRPGSSQGKKMTPYPSSHRLAHRLTLSLPAPKSCNAGSTLTCVSASTWKELLPKRQTTKRPTAAVTWAVFRAASGAGMPLRLAEWHWHITLLACASGNAMVRAGRALSGPCAP